ncbi:putative endo-1,4-beta-glucanase [Aspergillus melleus]|uniref:putative endo-1,4-beta-glucanase n=1 Tax=Aspergillus melleus TaxID=138277 RepID=UPI001E8E00EC|nr:uncharacterized protein LDX57_003528 [Aspergillus melleus]KAH8425784.1 hypothetical protein LDX57_003528 [Aspergillus melleus]
MHTISFILTTLLATHAAGHGHVTNVVINGVSYRGFDINSDPYNSNPPVVIAWSTPNTANGFISPDAFSSADVICHLDAKNARGHAVVAAGDKLSIQWTEWPESHHGPVVDYLASCGSSCETVDKTTLEFFKISGVGLVDGTTVPGFWGDDQLIENNNSWMVQIPPTIAPGHYVLRHELIALHGAFSENGAQNYMQCFNLEITGSGTAKPSGVRGTALYKPTDPGILVDIYKSLSTYVVPGPTLIPGAVSIVQSSSQITASGTPVTGSGGGVTTTTAGATTTTLSTTTSRVTTTTATSATRTTTAGGSVTSVQSNYGQCGGNGWAGPTACSTGATCTSYNDFYSQCLPTAA